MTASMDIGTVTGFVNGLERQAALFGVDPDSALVKKIEAVSEGIAALRSAREPLQVDIAWMHEEREKLIKNIVSGIRTGDGSTIEPQECDKLSRVPGYIAHLTDIRSEIERQIEEQTTKLAKLKDKLAEDLKSMIGIAEREAREKCRAFVHQGQGTRPVMSAEDISRGRGDVRVLCQSCERVIARVDVAKLGSELTTEAFTDLSGRAIFDGDGGYRTWRCRGCGLAPIHNPGWILTDSWRFLPVGFHGQADKTKTTQKPKRAA